MSKSESVCLVGGEEIPEHKRMYVFRNDSATELTRVPGRVCIEHGGNGRNRYAPKRYYAMVARAVVVEYDRIVTGNRTPEYDARHAVAFDNAGMMGADGEVVDVAEQMGFWRDDERGELIGLQDALVDALRHLQVYYRAFYPLRQGAHLPEMLEAFHAWEAQEVSLTGRDEGEGDTGESSPDEWGESNDNAVELLKLMAGAVGAGEVVPLIPDECKHEGKTFDAHAGRVLCDKCPQYWPTFVIGD